MFLLICQYARCTNWNIIFAVHGLLYKQINNFFTEKIKIWKYCQNIVTEHHVLYLRQFDDAPVCMRKVGVLWSIGWIIRRISFLKLSGFVSPATVEPKKKYNCDYHNFGELEVQEVTAMKYYWDWTIRKNIFKLKYSFLIYFISEVSFEILLKQNWCFLFITLSISTYNIIRWLI